MKKNIFIESLNILNGKIVYCDFDINENIAFADQKFSFKEDILQVEFDDNFLLDVGWYPEMEENGSFTVLAIKNNNWTKPFLKLKCRTLSELKDVIEKAVTFINDQHSIIANE